MFRAVYAWILIGIIFSGTAVTLLTVTRDTQNSANPIHLNLSGSEAETIDVSADGQLIAVTVAEELPQEKGDVFSSSVAVIEHNPHADVPLREKFSVNLGPGEITDVALDPEGHFLIANLRADDRNALDQLVLLRGDKEVTRVDLPDSADGIKLSPDGKKLVVAVEKGEMVQVYRVDEKGRDLKLMAQIGRDRFDPFFVGEEERLAREDLGPESAAFTPDGAMALVTLQEQASVAILDLKTLHSDAQVNPIEAGARVLVNVVHLPFGLENSRGRWVGGAPDGVSVSPDGSFALIANEAHPRSKHLMGLSVIDLREGPRNTPAPITHCIFDVDTSLLAETGLTSCPVAGANGEYPDDEDLLPRLDPNNTVILAQGDRLIAAVSIERATKGQDRGSILFLDVTDIVDGNVPIKIDRKLVGRGRGARPEGLQAIADRYVFVAIQNDGGTIARFDLVQ